jgi:hypothetical protein
MIIFLEFSLSWNAHEKQGGTAWEVTAMCTVDSMSTVSWGEAVDPKPSKKCEWPVKIPFNQSFREKSLFPFLVTVSCTTVSAVLVTRLIVTPWERWTVSAAVTECLLTLPPGLLWSELMHHSLSQPDGKIQPLSKCVLMYVTGICKGCLINTCIWTLLVNSMSLPSSQLYFHLTHS